MVIYKATNLINNKIYIGQTDNLYIRKIKRRSGALRGTKNCYFDNAIRKYGWENFKFEEIDSCESQEETDYMEKYWIKFYKATNKKFGYNLAEGGSVNRGYKKTEEQKRKITQTANKTWANVEKRKQQSEIMKNLYRNTEKGKDLVKKLCKPIKCIETGIIYYSGKEAANAVNLKQSSNLYAQIKGKQKTFGGFHWQYI